MAEAWAFANRFPVPTIFIVGIVCYTIYRIIDTIVNRGLVHPDDVDDDDDE